MNAPPEVGFEIEAPLRLSEDDIRAGASFVGDMNPIHHDADAAEAAGLPGLVASGSHVLGVYSALAPTRLRAFGRVLGADLDASFRAPIFADADYEMRWRLATRREKRAPGAFDLGFEGTISDGGSGAVCVEAKARLVLFV